MIGYYDGDPKFIFFGSVAMKTWKPLALNNCIFVEISVNFKLITSFKTAFFPVYLWHTVNSMPRQQKTAKAPNNGDKHFWSYTVSLAAAPSMAPLCRGLDSDGFGQYVTVCC